MCMEQIERIFRRCIESSCGVRLFLQEELQDPSQQHIDEIVFELLYITSKHNASDALEIMMGKFPEEVFSERTYER